ncbi:uncharacterized protein CC84DRAFT_828673 [Paraphaeosphaeria sporulosa]|uniref:Uncharacterized protein n=1 Tax=Paraphaeosphaeria sporulosa TaxID=1460663 RepID=A0A177CED8_9PLEO|nr:uncharacterized protein CC84DRAFT_828673 [Paraphaeosphaeria sporulosa]OAG05148.1 hypothetical protein CC84DRAFT_828673 [Paraphaeosphaeria sporulosa]
MCCRRSQYPAAGIQFKSFDHAFGILLLVLKYVFLFVHAAIKLPSCCPSTSDSGWAQFKVLFPCIVQTQRKMINGCLPWSWASLPIPGSCRYGDSIMRHLRAKERPIASITQVVRSAVCYRIFAFAKTE